MSDPEPTPSPAPYREESGDDLRPIEQSPVAVPEPSTEAPGDDAPGAEVGGTLEGDAIAALLRAANGDGPTEPDEPDPEPAAADVPPPTEFFDRASFLEQRDAILARVIARLEGPEAAEIHRTILAEVYVASLELRLSLSDLDGVLSQARPLMAGGLGKLLGRKGRSDG